MAVTGWHPWHFIRSSDASGASGTGKKIQQAKPDVCKCGTVHSGRPDDLSWKKFRSFSPCRTGDHRTWDLWNLWHYFCHAARRDRLFRIQEKFQRSGTDRCIPGIFRSVLIAVLTYFYKLDSIRGEMTEELEKRR